MTTTKMLMTIMILMLFLILGRFSSGVVIRLKYEGILT